MVDEKRYLDEDGLAEFWQIIQQYVKDNNADYDHMENKPKINGIVLSGDVTLEDLGVSLATDQQIIDLFGGEQNA